MNAVRSLGLLCISLLLAACASPFKADVVRFHQMNGTALGGTVLVRPEDEKRAESLEFNRYADLVGGALAQQGFAPPVAEQAPDYVARIEWDALPASGLKDNDGNSVGVGVGVGVSDGGHSGAGVGVSAGFSLSGDEPTAYIRRLTLIMTHTADNVRVFEGRAVSRGETSDMMEIMPYLVEALFKDFPGASGETISVQIPRK